MRSMNWVRFGHFGWWFLHYCQFVRIGKIYIFTPSIPLIFVFFFSFSFVVTHFPLHSMSIDNESNLHETTNGLTDFKIRFQNPHTVISLGGNPKNYCLFIFIHIYIYLFIEIEVCSVQHTMLLEWSTKWKCHICETAADVKAL